MSNKRKMLLYVMIGVIASCFILVFYSIANHSDAPQKQHIVKTGCKVHKGNVSGSCPQKQHILKTGNREFDEIANEVETSIANDNHYKNSENQTSTNNVLSTEYLDQYYSEETSQYKGCQLPNGSSPFDACFGKGIYSGNATLTIKNGANTDAIVCLYSIYSGRTIRNEYVRKNTTFKMDNISEGSYKIRVFYGNDWNTELENDCGTKGFFESDVSFSEFDGTKYFEDSYDGYTVATVTLYTVADGNASTSKISQSEFFGN